MRRLKTLLVRVDSTAWHGQWHVPRSYALSSSCSARNEDDQSLNRSGVDRTPVLISSVDAKANLPVAKPSKPPGRVRTGEGAAAFLTGPHRPGASQRVPTSAVRRWLDAPLRVQFTRPQAKCKWKRRVGEATSEPYANKSTKAKVKRNVGDG